MRRSWRWALRLGALAGGLWSPYSVFDEERLTPEFEARYVRASRIAYQAFQQLSGPRYGATERILAGHARLFGSA